MMRALQKCKKNKAPKMARELKERYSYRMGDVSEFMIKLIATQSIEKRNCLPFFFVV